MNVDVRMGKMMLKRRIVYIVTLIIIFWVNVLYIDYQPFIVLIIMLVFPLLLLLYITVARKYLSMTLKVDHEEVVRTDKLAFVIKISNRIILPAANIVIVMKFKYNNCEAPMQHRFVVNAKEFDTTKITGTMVMNYCGNLNVCVSKAYIYDPIGLFRLKLKCEGGADITVMPILAEPDLYTMYTQPNSDFDTQYYSNKTQGDDSSEVFDIREYRDGDNINRVHWKISAKEENLFVKEYSLPISKGNVILLELFDSETEEQRKNLDGVYEMAYAIGNFACIREKIYKLAYYSTQTNGLKLIEINSNEMLLEAIALVIQETTYKKEPLALKEFLTEEILECERVYYITTELTDDVISFLDETRSGKAFVYCIEDGNSESDSMETEGAMLIRVDRNDIKQGLKTVMI